ncbi:MAG: trypsin-like peptidase domain-containing protein [Nitrososphaerota archaeon]|nr:trypsin-like peptidase domain-containing protein [Nitrososphaerota archaeon]
MDQSIRMINQNRGLATGSAIIVVGVIIAIVAAGALVVYSPLLNSKESPSSTSTVTTTKTITALQTSYTNLANLTETFNPAAIYAYANDSIVVLQGVQTTTVNTIFGPQTSVASVLGSGFVISYNGQYYVVTNYHVAGATSNLTMTFPDGNAYPAKVVGSDPYSDLAIVQAPTAPTSEYHPLTMAPSSSLVVGQYVLAIGNPYGLEDTETFGIVSQLGGTIQDPTAGNFSIADVIQFSAPINPGNSGGALFDSNGSVVGITTATISGSQGIGFAIPSDTIMRELPALIANGTYSKHAYLGIGTVDMNYQLAQAAGTNVTYGVLVETVVSGGPSSNAGIRGGSSTVTIEGQQYLIGGDIIVGINGTKIINNNALSSYLEQYTAAGQKVTLDIIRSGQAMTLTVTLGQRPPI